MTILWWTNVVGDSTVEYGTTPALGSSVTVPTAGTRYYYRLLTNGVEVQPPGSYFTTLRTPSDPSDLFFTVIGDWGQASSGEADVANLQDGDDPPLILTVGDNAYQNGTQSDWDNNALAYYVNPMRRALFLPALGNHDLYDVGNANWASSVEIRMFQLPRNAPAGQEERYVSFDHGDAHFVVLDSNVPGDATQRAWLEADLAATPRKWKFVFLHHTPYSCANGFASLGSDYTVRSNWNPLFEWYGVDVASGLLTVSAVAKHGDFPVAAGELPLRFTIVVEGPVGENGQCGEATFISPTLPRCVLSATGTTLECR